MSFKYLIFALSLVLSLPKVSLAANGAAVGNLWTKTKLFVCFSDEDRLNKIPYKLAKWQQKEMSYIKSIIQNAYTENETILNFTGFIDCKNLNGVNPDVVVLKRTKGYAVSSIVSGGYKGSATLGRSFLYPNPNFKAPGGVIFSPTGLNKRTIIHEFGHIAGLLHEHEHYDARNSGKRCRHIDPKPKRDYMTYTQYDHESIMNYCSNTDELTELDKSLIRKLYEPVREKELSFKQ